MSSILSEHEAVAAQVAPTSDETSGWAYAMPVYSSFRRDSGAQVIAPSPEECVEAMWAVKCEIDGVSWEDWVPRWYTVQHGIPVTEGREEDIRVVPA